MTDEGLYRDITKNLIFFPGNLAEAELKGNPEFGPRIAFG
jgi:hypothetical protein